MPKTTNVTTHEQESKASGLAPSIGTPAWIVQVALDGLAPSASLAGLGAQVLVRSALLCGGIRAVSRASGDISPSANGLNKVLRNLPKRASAIDKRLPMYFASCVSDRVARRASELNALPANRRPTTEDVRGLMKSVAGAAARAPGKHGGGVADFGFTPVGVVAAVSTILQSRNDEVCMNVVDAQCVIAIGFAYLGLLKMSRCSWCFRWAWPGQPSCARHSLSAEVGGTRQQRQAGYEAAKRVCEHLSMATYSLSPRYHRLSDREALWVIGRIMFGATLVRETEVCEKLLAALARSPSLRSAALREGVDLSKLKKTQVVDEVRSWLDPAEVRPRVLLQEIVAAERWYRTAEKALPGQRSRGRATAALRHSALTASALPNATIATVANCIDLDRSTISHWFRRDGQSPEVRRLRAALVPARRVKVSRSGDQSR